MGSERSRITVVDDDLVTCELLCGVFSQAGFAVAFAQSAESALEAIAAARPDVIVSDIRMKGTLDGLGLLQRLRQEHPSIPVVLITGFGSIDTAIRAVKDGAFDYISKPFDLATLVETVNRALEIKPPARAAAAGDEDWPLLS